MIEFFKYLILSKLTAARNLPFNPEKRVYQYDDVFHPSPDIERALNGAEFIKWLGEQKRAREQGSNFKGAGEVI